MPNPVPAADTGLPVTLHETPLDRLRLVADALGVPMPEGLNTALTDADDAPAHAVLLFCRDNGVNLDFIYLGDVRIMVREVSKARRQEREKGQVA